MDTAKVDIQKLQLLNDRINQTIDALNQVRSSVHGLQSTAFGYGGAQGLAQGLMHSPVGVSPLGFGQIPGVGSPQMMASSIWPQAALAAQQRAGLSHSAFGGAIGVGGFVDPLLYARVASTFPYALSAGPFGNY